MKRLLQTDPRAQLLLRMVTFTDLEDTLGIAVNVASPTLLSFVNQFLAQRVEKLDVRKVLEAMPVPTPRTTAAAR